jgi:hypothetical protein
LRITEETARIGRVRLRDLGDVAVLDRRLTVLRARRDSLAAQTADEARPGRVGCPFGIR